MHAKNRSVSNRMKVTVLLGLLLLSFVSSFFYSPDFLIRKLDDQMDAALLFTGTAVGTATVLALVPDDSTTPIADQIASVASYMALACTAIMLEKFIAAVAGSVSLRWLIPIGLLLTAIAIGSRRRSLRMLGRRVLIAGLAILLVIPLSLSFDRQVDRVLNTEQLEQDCADLQDEIDIGWNIVESALESVSRVINRLFTLLAVKLLTCIVVPILVMMILISILKWSFAGIAGFLPDDPLPRSPRPMLPPVPEEEEKAEKLPQ